MSAAMDTPPLSKRRPKWLTSRFDVRVTQEERAALEAAAEEAGLSLSAYCRRLLFGRRVFTHQTMLVLNELRRIGGLLNKVHNESKGAYSQDTADAIQLIKSYLKAYPP